MDVIVTTERRARSRTSQPGDFEVTEDGKPQAIETFQLHLGDRERRSPATPSRRRSAPTIDEESEAARDDVRLFAIFLDDYHVRRGASMFVRKPLIDFVQNQLRLRDMVGIMYPADADERRSA